MRKVSQCSEDSTEFRMMVKILNIGMKMCNRSKKYKLSVNYKTRRKAQVDKPEGDRTVSSPKSERTGRGYFR